MREKLFEKSYKLLKEFVPEIMDDTVPDFRLSHTGKIDTRVRTYAERIGDNLVRIGTDWPINGKPSYDPLFQVVFDNDRKMARVKCWSMENIMFVIKYSGTIFDNYGCTFETEEVGREKDANDFLCDWLEYIVEDRQLNPNFFTKIPL